jgi:hypothetical protein
MHQQRRPLAAAARAGTNCHTVCMCGGCSQGVRRKNFKAVRATIEARLFAARPTFAGALWQIQVAVSQLAAVSFAHASANHTYTLQEYGELQAATRDTKSKPGLEAIADQIQKVCGSAACRQTSKRRRWWQQPCDPCARTAGRHRCWSSCVARCRRRPCCTRSRCAARRSCRTRRAWSCTQRPAAGRGPWW